MVTTIDIAWIAGLLEGEVCFSHHGTSRIDLVSTDEDVIVKARNILNKDVKIYIQKPKFEKHKTSYKITILGNIAISWMMTVYPLMGRRRKEKIREIIALWKDGKNTEIYDKNRKRRYDNQTVIALAKIQNISLDEAMKFLSNANKSEDDSEVTH